MRTVIVGFYLLFFYIISLPLFVIGWVIGKINPEKKPRYAQRIVRTAFRHIMFLSGVKMTVKGIENIPQDEPAMYAFNHRGFFDTLAGYVTAPIPSAFVAKDAMQHVPLVTRWMRAMNCLFLDRSDMRKGMEMIKEGIALLKGGTSIYIAPEGTRNYGDELLPFHQASFRLAEKSGRPIVPVAINNTDAVLERDFPWIHSAHIIIEYCEPIRLDDMTREEKKHVGEQVRDIISEKVKKNAEEL